MGRAEEMDIPAEVPTMNAISNERRSTNQLILSSGRVYGCKV